MEPCNQLVEPCQQCLESDAKLVEHDVQRMEPRPSAQSLATTSWSETASASRFDSTQCLANFSSYSSHFTRFLLKSMRPLTFHI